MNGIDSDSEDLQDEIGIVNNRVGCRADGGEGEHDGGGTSPAQELGRRKSEVV